MPPEGMPAPLYPWGRCVCDSCELAARCKAQLLACDAFASYVNGEPEKLWGAMPRAPRRALYITLLAPHADRVRTPEHIARARALRNRSKHEPPAHA